MLQLNEDDDELLEAVEFILENEILAQQQEMDIIATAMGHFGARMMAVMEDGFEIDDEELLEENWVKVTVNVEEYRLMGDPAFRMHFRLRKPTYEALLRELALHLIDSGRVHRVRTPLAIPLLMVLWILATPDSFRSVALRFGYLPADVHFHYAYIVEALREMAPKYIKWPNAAERADIKARFMQYSGFPGIVGCIDGTFNVVTAPLVQKQKYVNRHHQYSFNTMAVCDDTLLIRDLYIGEAGSMHDSRVFRRSPLYQRLLQDDDEQFIEMDEHVIGDSAYAVTDFLMAPFRNVGNLTQQQRTFNSRLSKCRVRIEHAFGKAFCQWRRMKMLHSMNLDLAVDHFMACFVLHNFMILNGEVLLDLDEPDFLPALNEEHDEVEEERVADDVGDFNRIVRNAQIRGIEKRLALVYDM